MLFQFRIACATLLIAVLNACSGGSAAPPSQIDGSFSTQRFSLSDGTTVVISMKANRSPKGVQICGAWQPFGGTAFGDRAAEDFMYRSKLYLGGDKLLNSLSFFQEFSDDLTQAQRQAACRDLDVPWKEAYLTSSPQAVIPRVGSSR